MVNKNISSNNISNIEKDIIDKKIHGIDINQEIVDIMNSDNKYSKLINEIDGYIEYGDFSKARNIIIELINNKNISDLSKADLIEKSGDLILKSGDYKTALKEYYKAKSLGKNSIYIKIVNTLQNNIGDDYDLILNIIKEELIEAIDNNINEAYYKLGEIYYYYLNDSNTALDLLKSGLENGINDCALLYISILEESLLIDNDYCVDAEAQIVNSYFNFIDKHNIKELYSNLGDFYKKTGKYYESHEAYMKDFRLNSNYLAIKKYADLIKYNGKEMPVFNQNIINSISIHQYILLSQYAQLNNDYINLVYSYSMLIDIYEEIGDRIQSNKYEDILLNLSLQSNDKKLQEDILLKKINKENISKEEETIIGSKLIELNPIHLITLGNIQEEKGNIQGALILYFRAYYLDFENSNNVFGMFIERQSINDLTGSLEVLSKKIYKNQFLNIDDINLINNFIQFN